MQADQEKLILKILVLVNAHPIVAYFKMRLLIKFFNLQYFSIDILIDIVLKCCRLNLKVFAQGDYFKKPHHQYMLITCYALSVP